MSDSFVRSMLQQLPYFALLAEEYLNQLAQQAISWKAEFTLEKAAFA